MSPHCSFVTNSVETCIVSQSTHQPHPAAIQPPNNVTLSPVSSLPTELLAHIFSFHAADEPHVFTRTSPSPTWLALSQVSRRWREISTGYPQLWTHLNLSNRHWTAEMLARSKPLPITIHAEFSGRPLMHAIEAALKEASRARQIHLSASIISRLIKPLRDQPAPLLESLELAQGVLPCVLPDDLFQGETPMLRSLKLNGMDIHWSSALLRPSLTHLEIRNTRAHGGMPQIEEMMRVLATMTSLQTLILVHALPGPAESPRLMTTGTEALEHCLPLPSIAKLHLSGTAASCASFLGHISIPLTTQLFIDGTPGLMFEPIQLVMEMQSMLAQHLSHTRDYQASRGSASMLTPFSKLAMSLSSEGQICLSAGQEGACEDGATTWQPALSVSLQWPPESPSVLYSELLVSRICALLPLAEVKSLSVEGNMLSFGSCWVEVFSKMRRVETLAARDAALAGLLEAFAWIKAVEEEGSEVQTGLPEKTEMEVMLFPGLKDLSIGTERAASVQLLSQLKEGLLLRKGPIAVQGSREDSSR